MSRLLKLLIVLFLSPVLTASAAERPNVLFISLDDMNDWLGCYGGHPDAITPNIDKLAERGVLFTNAHCVSPICGPSRASVLTGMRPETTGVYHNKGTYIDYVPDAVTFPEHFRANGYRALAAGKVNHNLGDPDPRLWDENGPDCGVLGTPFIDDELHTAMMTPNREINRGALKITLPANGGLSAIDRPNNTWDSFDWAPLDCPETDFPDRQIADWGVEQLSQKQEKPMLLALGFYKPHQPFFAPRKYFDLYEAAKVRLPSTIAGDLYDVPPPGRELATRPWTSGTHKTVAEHGAWREATHAYLATVSFADALVGRVIEALDNGPHADNTWIILWSDHGWSLGEKEHWGKHVPWREGVRMPLMIVPPKNSRLSGCEPGSRCDAPVSLLDLYPTLLDACGLPERKELEGRSLTPLIANVDTPWAETVVSTIGRGTHSLSSGDWRYIRYFDGSEELYDLKQDPREWFNLASKPEHADRMRLLAKDLPEDERFERFVRWGRWKCVFPVDGDPMLFDYQGDFGISEQTNVAAENPDVIGQIRDFLLENKVTERRVRIQLDEKNAEVVPKSIAEFVKISQAVIDGVPVGTILSRLGAKMEAGVSADQSENYDRQFGFTDRDGDGRHSKTEYIENGNYLNPQARRGIFNAADSDRDGYVTKAEYVLNRIITDEAKSIVQAMDEDGNGVVLRSEFVRQTTEKLLSPKLANDVFEALDTNGNGEIIIPEYLRIWGLWARVNRQGESSVKWKSLPPIPDKIGFAGPYAGVIDGNLIVAGGANFPGAPPWEGGEKAWHDRIFVLPAGSDAWKTAGFKLHQPLAYGVSISLPERRSIAMLGGSDSTNAPTTSAFELRFEEGKLTAEALPELPLPLAEMCGVELGNVLYLFSGRTIEGTARKAFRLNLNSALWAWEEIPWPSEARGRMHSVAGVRDGKIYLFAGRDVMSEEKIQHPEDRMEVHSLDFLRDSWRLDPATLEWSRLADLPHGLSAAPANAVSSGESELLVLGGVNVDFLKRQIAARPELNGQGHDHPGFPRTIWAYDTEADSWRKAGKLPEGTSAPVTVPVVPTGAGSFVIPSGEIKPGVRTTRVISGEVKTQRTQ